MAQNQKPKKAKKNNKGLRVFLIVFFSVLAIGLITAISLIASKKCSIGKKEEEETKPYEVYINQPESEKWELNVNNKTEKFKIDDDEDLVCTVKAKSSNIVYLNEEAEVYYIEVRTWGKGVESVKYPFELSYDSEHDVYVSQLKMYWSSNITISVGVAKNFESSYYSKDSEGVVNYVYTAQNLFDPTFGNIEKINVIDLTTTSIKRDEFNEEIWVGSELETVLPGFLCGCTNFNSPIHFENNNKLKKIEDNFLSGCHSFNQPINLPESVTTINGDFMFECKAFNQPFDTKNITTLDCNSFMYDCEAFNSTFTIGNALTAIPSNFLAKCLSFNKDLTIPENITRIHSGFMILCNKMVSTITINCPTSAFEYIMDTDNICSTDDGMADCYQFGIKIDGSSKTEFINHFPNIGIDEERGVVRKLIPTNK